MNACRVNSDCVGSQVDLDTRQVRCLGKELYCLEGTCVSTCQPECQVVRADVDPCESPAICAPRYVDVHLCTMKPVPCETKLDCPLFNPPYPDGGERMVDGLSVSCILCCLHWMVPRRYEE